MLEVFFENWAEIVLAVLVLADTIVSLTPTDKDDKALGYIRAIVLAVLGNSGNDDSGSADNPA
jgi:hypothetical protein